MSLWQKHWSNTSSDPRMQMLITEMGPKGYGIYWLISERLTACEEGAVMKQRLVKDMCSRRLNSNYILQVINNYYLFETDEGGYVRHHPVRIGEMSAHTLHDLKTGKLPQEQTHVQRASDTTPNSSYYNVRAGENRTENINITCMTHVSEKQSGQTGDINPTVVALLKEHPQVKTALGELACKPWCIHLQALFNPLYCMWRQVTCLHSGYSTLLDRHWEEAVVEFIHHIIVLDKADEIRSDQNAHYYFANFVNKYHASGKKLLAKLKEKERNVKTVEPAPSFPGTNSYEEYRGGKRYADGKPIPDWAPPRPSATAVWDAGSLCWTEL